MMTSAKTPNMDAAKKGPRVRNEKEAKNIVLRHFHPMNAMTAPMKVIMDPMIIIIT